MLHTDLRPKTLDEVLGNRETIKSLKSLLEKDDRPHCYMFHGKSGTGKSTLCRILANMLGASELDIHEYNIADTRGIDDAREIIQQMNYQPYGESTIIILDEIHQATRAFQEVLLKPTEDIPKHAYVFIATTEPNKIIPTLRRRFMQFETQPVESDELFMYIVSIAKKYNVKLTKDVVDSLLEQSYGSVATALVLLEKVMYLSKDEQLSVLDASKNNAKGIIDLCQALLYGKSWSSIISIVSSLDENPEGYRRIIMNYMMKVLLNPKSGKNHLQAANIINIFSDFIDTKEQFVLCCYNCTII